MLKSNVVQAPKGVVETKVERKVASPCTAAYGKTIR